MKPGSDQEGRSLTPEERADDWLTSRALTHQMRGNLRKPLARLVRDSEQAVVRRVLEIVREQAEAWRAGARRVDEGGVLNLLPGTSAADAAADNLDGQARGADSLAETIAAAFPEPHAEPEEEAP